MKRSEAIATLQWPERARWRSGRESRADHTALLSHVPSSPPLRHPRHWRRIYMGRGGFRGWPPPLLPAPFLPSRQTKQGDPEEEEEEELFVGIEVFVIFGPRFIRVCLEERGGHHGSSKEANVFHRDLKPKNILANADCKLKICDFGLARVAFNDAPSAIFWTDYVATRWYRAPELCGSFFSKYTPAIDIWSIGCIFAEMLTGKPVFPGKNVVHQLDLMTDLLGTPSAESIARIRNEKARRYLSNMRKKPTIPFSQKFPGVDPLALHLLERLLAFDPKDRPTAEEIGFSNLDALFSK
ncbi:hypothetical protein C4D60_Mb04t10840 [Musa balbisiana]|uniref:Protein kinase domain-containing protein n=1 Tax=Musa balbisiana TaxID=52838 RepID=A0A4S8KB95_MUSBA|nr:hypothetical protein C4D60_Mb04t10840 [Musa balbisiana]